MNIAGLNKAKILAALYNGSKQQGLGHLDLAGKHPMTDEQASAVLEARKKATGELYFDYLNGRVMKVDLGKDDLWTRLYNRDNGPGAAERIIEGLIER